MSETDFTPPTPQQLAAHLRANAPQVASRFWSMMPLIALGLVAGLTFTTHSALAALLPFVVIIVLMLGMGWRLHALRRLEQRAARVQELALMRYHPQALRLAWRSLPQIRAMHEIHGRTIAAIAHCLDQVGAYEASIVAYDDLIGRLPPDHPTTLQLVIQRSIAQLMCDHLTDADDALRRVRAMLEPYAGTPVAASFHLAGLLQQVQTHHFADAVDEADQLVEQLRPLGVEAGYGYALMALSHFKTDQPDAGAWWKRATMLLPPATLTGRFNQLAAVAQLAPAQPPEPLDKA